MREVRIGILGELDVRVGERAVPIPRGKQQLLLAALTLRRGQFVGTDELIDQVWADDPPPSARTTLRGYVKRLRTRFANAGAGGRLVIEALPGGYRLDAAAGDTDLSRFRLGWQRARGCDDAVARLETLGAALALWRGRPLSGLPRMEWVEQAAVGLEQEWLQAVECRMDLLIGEGQAAAAAVELHGVLAEQPFRESLWSRLLLALHHSGRTADALLKYDEVRRLLADRLGVEPSGQLRALHQRLLREDPPTETAVPAVSVVPAEQGGSAPTGRDSLVAALDALADAEGAPGIVVVDGPAGVGKTALARYWADHAAHRFPGGLLHVDLRGFHQDSPASAHDALGELLCAAGTPEAELPGGVSARAAAFRRLTAQRRMLVLLDNARDAEQVRPLLPGTGSVALVTSQSQLRGLVARDGAVRLSVAPLGVRDGAAVVAALAGRELVAADPAAVYELVELCGGLPLALRIAVERLARVPGLTPAALVQELRREETRLDLLATGDGEYASVRATLGRAAALLRPEESALLYALASEAKTDFDVDDAARLIGGDGVLARVRLDRLVALNLVDQRSVRGFHLPELRRVAAGERP
ncbi:AfsR/SARP family transcriptional regulator [Prauserella cavernicola]|uniref:Winged helix-turn-helix domain-containing protein n=1 Tax=Prauserella cavernicola TaxID=2800127 RepID=A0A934QMK6_9PSEU|nr:BTAD domain-containing putative transcriptional regulator [Prauserella cavernicola]MBK1783276.1 winged helix-turn-helix domain-containing protein [Prauserella cavernicola]